MPSLALALEPGQIVPCNTPGNDKGDCNYGTLIQGIQSLLTFLIYFSGIVAVLLFIYAGVKLIFSGGNEGAVTDAKKIFWNTTIGFLIVISAYLIVSLVLSISGVEGTPIRDLSLIYLITQT